MKDIPLLLKRGPGGKLLAGLCALLILLTASACGGSNTVHVYDNAHVLNTSSVQNAASNLPYSLDIYTTSTFTGDKSGFQNTTISKLHGNTDLVVMAIDTTHRYIYIARGTNVSLSQSGINAAVSAFSSHFGNGNYTDATLAAIRTLQQSSGAGTGSSGNAFAGLPFALLCIGALLLVALVAGFGIFRRRRFGGMPSPAHYQQPPAYPYNQGNYYGPPGNQGGGGMNPWAAGGLGAAAGGFLGYELGKEAGEREAREHDNPGGGDFGGGGGGDFGGGGGGDFGGGGGGDFGGGGGGDFGGGGGGDFGGGGGGSDF